MSKEIKNKSIAIDLTPLLPGGDNGGAKLMTLELLKNLFQLHPTSRFLLITSDRNDEELASLERENVKRIKSIPLVNKFRRSKWWIALLLPFLPFSLLKGLRALLTPLLRRFKIDLSLKKYGADLLFCPFTAPTFAQYNVPVVSVIYDLQHKTYPQFFTPQEYQHRETFFTQTFSKATQIICISNYVRQTVVNQKMVNASTVHTVPIQLSTRLPQIEERTKTNLFARFQLSERRFLFFPANFWHHKNHHMLFTAFGMYKAAHLDSDLKLICTGSPGTRMEELKTAVIQMGLSSEIHFPGYVSHKELAVFMNRCKALIFPSLYEGFGMPILEAMTAGTPVLCSKCTSLPEIAGNAALFFDPKRPQTIVDAITTLESNPSHILNLIERGKKRAALFSNAPKMAHEYSQIFQLAMHST